MVSGIHGLWTCKTVAKPQATNSVTQGSGIHGKGRLTFRECYFIIPDSFLKRISKPILGGLNTWSEQLS